MSILEAKVGEHGNAEENGSVVLSTSSAFGLTVASSCWVIVESQFMTKRGTFEIAFGGDVEDKCVCGKLRSHE